MNRETKNGEKGGEPQGSFFLSAFLSAAKGAAAGFSLPAAAASTMERDADAGGGPGVEGALPPDEEASERPAPLRGHVPGPAGG